MRSGHRVAALGAAAVLTTSVAVGLTGATPAFAAPPPPTATVTPTSPVSSTKTPTITGHIGGATLIDSYTLALTRAGGQKVQAGCETATTGACKQTSDIDYTWKPTLAYNGRYHLDVTASGTYVDIGNAGCALSPCSWTSGPADFAVAVPPAAPKGLLTEVSNASRTVNVSWARNTEPDMIGYVIERSTEGGAFAPVASAAQSVASRVSIADLVPDAGKKYTYRVIAVRQGADACDPQKPGDCDAKAVKSAASTVLSVDVPAGAPAGTGASVPGGLNLTGVGAPKGKGAASSTGGYKAPPDTGYKTNLPYDGVPPPAVDEPAQPPPTEAGQEAALPATPRHTVTRTLNIRALAVPLAGGAILFVLALQIRWLTRRMTRVHDLA